MRAIDERRRVDRVVVSTMLDRLLTDTRQATLSPTLRCVLLGGGPARPLP